VYCCYWDGNNVWITAQARSPMAHRLWHIPARNDHTMDNPYLHVIIQVRPTCFIPRKVGHWKQHIQDSCQNQKIHQGQTPVIYKNWSEDKVQAACGWQWILPLLLVTAMTKVSSQFVVFRFTRSLKLFRPLTCCLNCEQSLGYGQVLCDMLAVDVLSKVSLFGLSS
jgi:hypothetical protein